MPPAEAQRSFGGRLKSWRQNFGLSQLQLAVDVGVSPRHLSFIETGRSQPSREMVLRLAEHLRVPLREQNALLLSAGFAPGFEEQELEAPSMTAVRDAALLVLKSHDPFPAIAIDRRRNIVLANRGAQRLNEGLEAARPAPGFLAPPVNIFRLLLHPNGLAKRIVNFGDYRHHLLARLRRDTATSRDPELAKLLAEIEAYPNMRSAGGEEARAKAPRAEVALTLRLRIDDGPEELAFITTLATFGTPFDVTVSELVIESLFPADEHTARYFRTPP